MTNPKLGIRFCIEIAHALSYERYGAKGIGHGRLWKKICIEIGQPQELVVKIN